MLVEVWSDVVCPWCYIGKRRFETALRAFDGAADVEVVWRSFMLNPEQPKGAVDDHDTYLARKMGASHEQIAEMNARVTSLAAAEGLDYHLETCKVINTMDAHRVLHLATSLGVGTQAHERLLRAQLVEGQLLEDPGTLVRLAVEVGVPEARAREVVGSDAFTAEVVADLEEAQALGIHGVPFFVFDRQYGVSGAQAVETFVSVLERLRSEAAARPKPQGQA